MMATIMLEDRVHPLNTDHSTMMDGFVAGCPKCGKAWAYMEPVGLPSTAYGFIRHVEAPCKQHGGSLLRLFTMGSVVYLPLYYGCLDRAALLQILMSEKE